MKIWRSRRVISPLIGNKNGDEEEVAWRQRDARMKEMKNPADW